MSPRQATGVGCFVQQELGSPVPPALGCSAHKSEGRRQSGSQDGPEVDLHAAFSFSGGFNSLLCFNSFTVFVSFIVSLLKAFLDL
jgi:hypothetical protein